MSWHLVRTVVLTFALAVQLSVPTRARAAESQDNREAPYVTNTIRGRVVWLADALTRLHGIQTVPEARDRILALETADGQLYPLVEDVRGRAFRYDKRLREMNVELLVRQHRGSPMVQIVRVFELTDKGRFEIDYWCEICSIALFELKDCDCCQGPIELRRQPAKVD